MLNILLCMMTKVGPVYLKKQQRIYNYVKYKTKTSKLLK